MKNLTRRQTEILAFLKTYQERHGGAPTLQEICDHFDFRSLSSAQEHLRLIERKGFLTKKPHSSRSIRLVRPDPLPAISPTVLVPLLGKIAAGSPTFALEDREAILPLPKSLFGAAALFALRVQGDSMVNAGIFDQDIAILRAQPDFANGDIAAVVIDEEATLKRVFRIKAALRLHAENEVYPDRIIPAGSNCRVAGVLVGTIRKFN